MCTPLATHTLHRFAGKTSDPVVNQYLGMPQTSHSPFLSKLFISSADTGLLNR